jgi:hypothetical protein
LYLERKRHDPVVLQKLMSRADLDRQETTLSRKPDHPFLLTFPKKNSSSPRALAATGESTIEMFPCAFKTLSDTLREVSVYEGMPTEDLFENLPSLLLHELAHFFAKGS